MMNILVINGSPKGERSNTWRLTRAFLEGMSVHEVVHAGGALRGPERRQP